MFFGNFLFKNGMRLGTKKKNENCRLGVLVSFSVQVHWSLAGDGLYFEKVLNVDSSIFDEHFQYIHFND